MGKGGGKREKRQSKHKSELRLQKRRKKKKAAVGEVDLISKGWGLLDLLLRYSVRSCSTSLWDARLHTAAKGHMRNCVTLGSRSALSPTSIFKASFESPRGSNDGTRWPLYYPCLDLLTFPLPSGHWLSTPSYLVAVRVRASYCRYHTVALWVKSLTLVLRMCAVISHSPWLPAVRHCSILWYRGSAKLSLKQNARAHGSPFTKESMSQAASDAGHLCPYPTGSPCIACALNSCSIWKRSPTRSLLFSLPPCP